jgi:uncharacterized protein DUF1638
MKKPMLLKVIACEIAVREFCHTAARSPNIIDLEFLSQGHHDTPCAGRKDLQEHINAVPAGKYDAIILGYGLCSNLLAGLTTAHTPLVIPRAHDCITLFMGSKTRYQESFDSNPGTYYYTSGWLECSRRRGAARQNGQDLFMPASSQAGRADVMEEWVKKYGQEKAEYLFETMGQWSSLYKRGVLIDFDFTKHLNLRQQVQQICTDRGWDFAEVPGDLGLFQRLLDGDWRDKEVLVVRPAEQVAASFDEGIVEAQKS